MPPSNDPPRPALDGRAMKILLLASEGRADKEIAREMGVPASTVDYHWRKIKRILDASDRTQAVVRGLNLAYREQYALVVHELEKTKRLEEELRKANERVAEQWALEQRVYADWIQNQYSVYQTRASGRCGCTPCAGRRAGAHNVEAGLWPARAWTRYAGKFYENP